MIAAVKRHDGTAVLAYNLEQGTYVKCSLKNGDADKITFSSTSCPDGHPVPHHRHTLETLKVIDWGFIVWTFNEN